MQARLIRSLLWLASRLPIRASRALGRGLGHVAWLMNGSYCGVTRRNIELAFPEMPPHERDALARRSILATAELVAEMGFVWMRPWAQVNRLIEDIRGEDAVREAQKQGRGVLLLGPHLGNWELAGLYMASLGRGVTLYEPPHIKALDEMVRAARSRSGVTLVPTNRRGLAVLVRALREGAIVAILPDQIPPVEESGENSVFMGQPAFTMTLVSKLLAHTGAAAFFSFGERTPGGFRIHHRPADERLYSDDMTTSLKALNDGVEAALRLCPEQYQWEYKRFRTRPRGDHDNYANL